MNPCDLCGTVNDAQATSCKSCGNAIVSSTPPASRRLRIIPPAGGEGQWLELPPGEFICGRAPEASIRLEDPFVSPRHAQLVVGASVWITDLGSPNGVFLRLRGPTPLQADDEVRLGQQRLRLEALPRPSGAMGGGRIWGSGDRGHHFRLARVLEGGGTGEAMALADGDYLIGRDEGGMTFPGDLAVSGRHAILSVSGEQLSLRDLGSANGTFVRLHEESELVPGDQLLMGQQQLRLE